MGKIFQLIASFMNAMKTKSCFCIIALLIPVLIICCCAGAHYYSYLNNAPYAGVIKYIIVAGVVVLILLFLTCGICRPMFEEEGRTMRHKFLAAFSGIMLCALGCGGAITIYAFVAKNHVNSPHGFIIGIITMLVFLIIMAAVVHYAIGMMVANDNIFHSSSDSVKPIFYESAFLQTQTLLAIFVVGVAFLFMASNTIQESTGVSIITLATAFALSKEYKKTSNECSKSCCCKCEPKKT